MDREEFFQQIKEQIKQYLPEDYQDGEVLVREVDMAGEKRMGLAVITGRKETVPMLDLEYYVSELQKGIPVKTVLQEMGTDYCVLCEGEISAKVVKMDSRQFYDHLHVAVLNFEKHRIKLKGMPYLKVNDLAVIPMLRLPTEESIPIDLRIAGEIGVSGDLLLAKAMKNHASVLHPVFKTLGSSPDSKEEEISLQDGKVLEKNDPFYMLSNTDSLYGAAALVDKPLLSQVGKKLGEDFYILPASMDGLIIVPKGVTDDPSWLKGISENQRINDRSSHDFLSDNIYIYDSKSQEVSLYDGSYHRENVKSYPTREGR